MASTFTTNKSIEKPGNGDYVNTWSTPVNDDWDIIDASLGGTTTLNATGASGTVTLTVGQYRPPTIIVSGVLTANVTYSLPSGVGGQWVVYNITTGSFTVTLASAGGGTSVVITQGKSTLLFSDGTNVRSGVSDIPALAGGSSGQVQFNNAGNLAGSTNFTYDGTSIVVLGATALAELRVRNVFRIYGSTSGYVGLTVPAAAGSTTYTFPSADGTSGQVLTTSGTGILSWTTVSGGGGGGGVTSFSSGTTGLTPVAATTGAVQLGGTLSVANGGTGQTTYTNGQLLIGNTTGNTLTKSTLTAGTGINITNGAGSITIGLTSSALGLPTLNVVSGTSQVAASGNQYVLTNVATTTLTLPSSPAVGDTVWVTVGNGLTTNVVARNGTNIQGLAEDLTLNWPYAAVQLRYSDPTNGWIFS